MKNQHFEKNQVLEEGRAWQEFSGKNIRSHLQLWLNFVDGGSLLL